MKTSLVKLQKFFKLEAERGYDNHAVLGGLERIPERWESEARAESVPEDLIQAISDRLRDYPRLAATSRAEVLEGLMRRIQRAEGGPIQALPQARESREPRPERQPGPKPEAPTRKEAPGLAQTPPSAAQAPERDERASPVARGLGSTGVLPRDEAEELPAVPNEAVLNYQSAEEPGQDLSEVPSLSAPAHSDDIHLRETAYYASIRPSGPPAALNAPVTVLPGVGPRHAQTLERLGLKTLRDMLYYFPRRYDDYSQLKPINRLWYGEEVTVIGTVQTISTRPVRGGKAQIVEAVVSDGTGALRITWFNQGWIAKRLHGGAHIVLSGRIDQYLGRLVLNNPEWEPLEQQQLSTNRIVPVYSLTSQITQRWLRRLMHQVITYWAPRVQDPLPAELRRSAGVVDLPTALLQAHFPDTQEDLRAARQRLAFDEIFLLQLGVLGQKRAWQDRNARKFETDEGWFSGQVNRLPFPLTGAQQRAVEDVRRDLVSGRPMNRLLQGDVGSGKTVIGALAIAMVVQHGAQAAIMAPTSILAEQHYKSLLRMLSQNPEPAVNTEADAPGARVFTIPEEASPASPALPPPLQPSEIRLMVGATPEAEKREIRAGLASGEIRLVVGTHALIEDPITFQDLQLVIVDEQHRFGVEQRAALRRKGENPHLLVMTATPIPRSLALTVYGDLDLSVMDEMPPGRQVVATYVITPLERERAYSLIRSQVELDRQAFIIYPLVAESDNSEAKAAVEEHARLQAEIFPRLKLGLLHGRMKPEEKDTIMTRFRDGELHVLVSTSVVEVGVDVPNATVMLIEGANHFGLAQLHQFRGRVGRGAVKSYCLLIPDAPDSIENERLQAMCETNDGFVLAERDLEQRGPGQFLGTRQSGYSELKLANLTDVHLIEKARRFAQVLFESDPGLERAEHRPLSEAFQRFWSNPALGDIS